MAPQDRCSNKGYLLFGSVLLLSGLVVCLTASAQQKPTPERRSSAEPEAAEPSQELTPEARRAIKAGIRWLAREQKDTSGRWPTRSKEHQMSVTALAGLALLAHGASPDRGPYAKQLRLAITWVLESQKTTGAFKGLLFRRANPMGRNEKTMHGHGFALLFLGQAYGQSHDKVLRKKIHEALKLAAVCTKNSISPRGGWFYWPARHPGANRQDEGSVTITQIQGLRSARNAGVEVDAETVKRAVSYIRRSQQPDGGVRYTINWGKTSAALTAAGIAVLQGAGEYDSPTIKNAYGYLRQKLLVPKKDNAWFFYTHLYAAQAMYQRGGPEWHSYWPRIRTELLHQRRGRPYWESRVGRSYGTAVSLLILQLPLRYLPIFQR